MWCREACWQRTKATEWCRLLQRVNHISATHVRHRENVRHREAEMRFPERHSLFGVRRVQHHVGQRDWNGWTAVGIAHRGGDVARHLDGAALVVEEPKPVPAARRVQFGRLCHDLHTTRAQCCGESIDRAVDRWHRTL